MNKTVLALTTALLLAGGAATTASAQTTYYDDNGTTYHVYGDVDRVVRYDSYGNRYYYDRYGNRIVMRDRDCDGVPDAYDQYSRDMRDADCDGVPDRYDSTYNGYGERPYNYQHSRWSVGSYLPYSYYGMTHSINYEDYGLPPTPYGYRWTRIGSDAYMVSISSGRIVDVIYGRFH